MFCGKVTAINTGIKLNKCEYSDGRIMDACKRELLNRMLKNARKVAEDCNADSIEVASWLIKEKISSVDEMDIDPDFYSFADEVIQEMLDEGRRRGDDIRTVIRSMNDYHPDLLPVSAINRRFIDGYCSFCRTTRVISRSDQYGRVTRRICKPISEDTIQYRLKVIKSIINKMKCVYIDENGITLIRNNVFSNIRLKQPIPSRHDRAVPVQVVRDILKYETTNSRQWLAKDMFLLSFLTCGTNLIDFFKIPAGARNGDKLTYSRSKTADKRNDNARITLNLSPFCLEILERYADPSGSRLLNLYNMYSSLNNLQKAVSDGLKQIKEAIGYDGTLTYYCARHTFATIAANDLGVSVDMVGRCLNHSKKTVTSFYIKPDFRDIWKVQKEVESFILEGE